MAWSRSFVPRPGDGQKALVQLGRLRCRPRARGGSAPRRRRRVRAPGPDRPPRPTAIACTRTLPSAVASTGPANTGSPVRSAVSWHSSRLRAPPPTTWSTSNVRPVTRCSRSSTKRYLQASEVRIERTISPGSFGGACAPARHASRIRAGMSPGRQQRLVVGVEQRHVRVGGLGQREQLVVVGWRARALPGPPAFLQEPQTHHVSQQAGPPVHAALVGQVVLERASVEERTVRLGAEQRPRSR